MDYESPLGDIIRAHDLTAHFYADGTQVYLAFDYDNEASSMAIFNPRGANFLMLWQSAALLITRLIM